MPLSPDVVRERIRDHQELTAFFGVEIGRRWVELYEAWDDSVGVCLLAIDMATDFLALWHSGIIEEIEGDNFDGSWLDYIELFADDYFHNTLWVRRQL
jgi:hypothetical protein